MKIERTAVAINWYYIFAVEKIELLKAFGVKFLCWWRENFEVTSRIFSSDVWQPSDRPGEEYTENNPKRGPTNQKTQIRNQQPRVRNRDQKNVNFAKKYIDLRVFFRLERQIISCFWFL